MLKFISELDKALDAFYANESWKTITEWTSHGTCIFSYHKYNRDIVTKTEHTDSVLGNRPIYSYNNREISYRTWAGYTYNNMFTGTFEDYLPSRNTFRQIEIVKPHYETSNNETLDSDASFQFFPNTGSIDIPSEAQYLFSDYCR